MDPSDGRKMDTPPEGNVDTNSSSENEDKPSGSGCQSMSEDMKAKLRRQLFRKIWQEPPAPIQNRVVCLKNLQLEYLTIEAEFFEEVYKLEQKYQLKYQPLFDKRMEVVLGTVEPAMENPEGDCKEPEHPTDVKGIPGFWLTVFRTMPILSEMVRPRDEPAMRKLSDITIKYADEHSYTLEFHFDKNEYFTNSVLTKQYFLKTRVDPDHPFAYEGPEMYKCKGCTINWEEKMNLTVKTIRKKRGNVKWVPTDSFFNFFNPPEVPIDKDDIDDDSRVILAHDFLVGHILRGRIVPRAVLYFTGDIVDDEDDDDDDDDIDEEEFDHNEDFEYDADEDDVPPAEDQTKPADGGQKKIPNDCPNQ